MPSGDEVDYDKLEEYFRALSYSTRIELLHILRFPMALQDIRLRPRQVRPGQNPERPAARQTIQEHLDRLIEIGVVVPEESGKGRKLFKVNGAKLYQITEEFRQVGAIMADSIVGRDATVGVGGAEALEQEPGPKLVLVHGMLEGKAFPLQRADLSGKRGWVLGRKAGLHVSLEYDPFVSLENSEIIPDGNDYLLVDLRSSRNGTFLNWRRLGPDVRAPLQPGHVIGIGRSLLVFQRS